MAETITAVGASHTPKKICEEIGMSSDIIAFQQGRGVRPEPTRLCQYRDGGQALCGALVTLVERPAETLGPTMYPAADKFCPYAAKLVDEPVLRPAD